LLVGLLTGHAIVHQQDNYEDGGGAGDDNDGSESTHSTIRIGRQALRSSRAFGPNPDKGPRSRTTRPANHGWTLMNKGGFLGNICPPIRVHQWFIMSVLCLRGICAGLGLQPADS
jgi:hypothetical protein